jgi:hypothetical protein
MPRAFAGRFYNPFRAGEQAHRTMTLLVMPANAGIQQGKRPDCP